MSDRVCYDRYLPGEPPPEGKLIDVGGAPSRAAFWVQTLWPTGSELRIGFLGGSASQREAVIKELPEWTKYANLKFEFGDVYGSQIRISFDPDEGAYSYMGKHALQIPANVATMNLGWLDGGVILHEGGHMVGMVHEHQNPRGKQIAWNKPVVNAALRGSPNYWSQSMIDSNMYEKYALNQINGSDLDRLSVMMYFFPPSWTLDGFSTNNNPVLSALDKQFAIINYPGRDLPPDPGITPIVVQPALTAGVSGSIGKPGEEDLYTFAVVTPGKYIVETLGDSDVMLSVLSSAGVLLGTDDDSGLEHNASLSLTLPVGNYRVQVRHYSRAAVGEYSVRVLSAT